MPNFNEIEQKESTPRSGNLIVGEEGEEGEKPNFQVGYSIFQKIITPHSIKTFVQYSGYNKLSMLHEQATELQLARK